MKDFDLVLWKKTVDRFTKALGKERVITRDLNIVLRFDFSRPEQFSQFEQFGKLAHSMKNVYFTISQRDNNPLQQVQTVDKPQIMEVVINHQTNMEELVGIAGAMIIAHKEPNGEIRRPIIPGEPGYLLEEKTGVPWVDVQQAPYADTHIVEAVLSKTPDLETRATQERAVAYLLLPKHQVRNKVHEWVGIQEQTEKTHRIQRRTAVPADWVAKLEQRLEEKDVPERFLKQLPAIFER